MMLSIIIPSNLLDQNFECCLRALEKASLTDGFEIIIVLDGIAKSDVFFSQFRLPNLQIIVLENNKGPAFARNQGAEAAAGDVLFFVDADVSLHADTIGKIVSHFEQVNAPDAVIGSYDDAPEYPSLVSKFRNLLHHYTHQNASLNASTFWSACGAIKKDVFYALNGFNTSYNKPSVEDIELGYRLIESGGNIRLDKSIQVKHLKRWTLFSMIHTDVLRRGMPWTKLIRHHDTIEHTDLNVKQVEKVAAVLIVLALVCLLGGIISAKLLFVSTLFIAVTIVLNRDFYAFLGRKLSVFWLPGAVLLHFLYYLSAVTGFILGSIVYLFGSRKKLSLNHNSHTFIK